MICAHAALRCWLFIFFNSRSRSSFCATYSCILQKINTWLLLFYYFIRQIEELIFIIVFTTTTCSWATTIRHTELFLLFVRDVDAGNTRAHYFWANLHAKAQSGFVLNRTCESVSELRRYLNEKRQLCRFKSKYLQWEQLILSLSALQS